MWAMDLSLGRATIWVQWATVQRPVLAVDLSLGWATIWVQRATVQCPLWAVDLSLGWATIWVQWATVHCPVAEELFSPTGSLDSSFIPLSMFCFVAHAIISL